MRTIAITLCVLAILAGCTTVEIQTKDPVTGAVTTTVYDETQSKFAVADHADLMAAAAIAEKNGYPAVAGWYRAHDLMVRARLAQISACENAIADSLRSVSVDGVSGAGPWTKFEVAREVAAKLSAGSGSASVAVKINCEPLPLPLLPRLPRIP